MPNDMSAPDPRRRNIIVAVVVGVVLLCCCCLALAVGAYLWSNGDELMQQFSRVLPALAALA
jgi:hypothetical protein